MTDSISKRQHQRLSALAKDDITLGIKRNFDADASRTERFSFELGGLFIDFSKTHLSQNLLSIYSDLSSEAGFIDKRARLFKGDKINQSEQRSVLHTLLRNSSEPVLGSPDADLVSQAVDAKQQFIQQYQQLEKNLANRSEPITDIIHVGIGGSSLGTQLFFESMREVGERRRIHFLSNIDGHQIDQILEQCRPESTLVIGVSKTFSTAETLMNLDVIAQWFVEHDQPDFNDNFLAVTANFDNALAYGILESNIVTFPEWVGGRYSVWSSVSLSAVLLLGIDAFEQFLAGAALLDEHFYMTDPDQNICFIAAALDHYYSNFLNAGSRGIFAYDARLEQLVDYLQQLETESNGKDRQVDGEPVDVNTSAVIWGGIGTDVQHSVFQLLHQGTALIPAEFILTKHVDHAHGNHHTELLANGIAQTAALLAGQDLAEVQKNHAGEGLNENTSKAKIFSGERPSTTLLLDKLNPHTLGLMLAFYEHRTFCGGVLANINSFDQMGVELGKRLAKQVKPRLTDGDDQLDAHHFDASTEALIGRILS